MRVSCLIGSSMTSISNYGESCTRPYEPPEPFLLHTKHSMPAAFALCGLPCTCPQRVLLEFRSMSSKCDYVF